MPIHLEKINLKNLGPLASFNHSLGLLNLIYGQNETGKTYLVEFLLGAIFRHSSSWSLREFPADGAVTILGLRKESSKFTLKTRKKIEDYWEENKIGLPLNMARMLVVKGGDLSLSDTPGGVNRAVLKTTLTTEVVLNKIREPISKTVQAANLDGQEITGANRGIIKDRQDLLNQVRRLRGLLDRVENEYSQGPLCQIELKISGILDSINNQEEGKNHLAYKLHQSIKSLKNEKEKLSDEVINNLQMILHEHKIEKENLKTKENTLRTNQKNSRHYTWLINAISVWEKQGLELASKLPGWVTIVGISLLLIGLILFGINNLIQGFDLLWIGLPLALISAGMLTFTILRLQQWTHSITDADERQSIIHEFKSRFGNTLWGLSELKEKKELIQKSYFLVEPLEKEIQELNSIQNQRRIVLVNILESLSGYSVPEKEWETTFQDLKKKSLELTENIQSAGSDLNKLDVPEKNLQEKPAAEEYNPQRVLILNNDLDELRAKLAAAQGGINSLKQVICHETGDDFSTTWEDVLFHLRSITEEKEQLYQIITARLIAEIGVVQVLDRIEKEEDQKIQRALNTNEMSSLLLDITGSYQSLDLINDQLFVSDQYSRYSLSSLSTGAREQIQLAIRLGIAENLTGGDPLFLILDDAFQHSDWDRRERLVKQIIRLTKTGWQITYLCMDDHIRDLFLKYGQADLSDDFTYIELK